MAHTQSPDTPNALPTTEAQVRAWAAGLEDLHQRIAPRFARSEVRHRALTYLKALLSTIKRKNGWQVAEFAGDGTPDGIQRLLNAATWDADQVRDDLHDYVVEHLGDAEAVLVVDETGFVKKGSKSVGVHRQYSGTAGRIENCQVGVFLAYASVHGLTLCDRELYLPKAWAADQERCRAAGVPEQVGFAIKPRLAQQMLERAVAKQVPFTWVTADSVYGSDAALRQWLEAQPCRYIMGIASNDGVWIRWQTLRYQLTASEVAASPQLPRWERLSCGNGSKGPRVYDWAWVSVDEPAPAGWQHWLVLRRSLSDPTKIAYYRACVPQDTDLTTLVQVAGRRWTVEESLEVAKDEVGLDHYEVRQWQSWYRHITLAMLAQAYLAVTRAHAAQDEQAKRGSQHP